MLLLTSGAAPLLTTKPVKDLLSTIMIRFSKRKLLTRVFLSATHIHASRNTTEKKNSTVKFNINDDVNHPKFGKGTIEHIEQLEGSVRLHVEFGEDLKKIDQRRLLQAGMKKAGAPRRVWRCCCICRCACFSNTCIVNYYRLLFLHLNK